MNDRQRLAKIGARAAALVHDGDTVGLGSGSTATAMVDALGERVRKGLRITAVATSTTIRDQAAARSIPLVGIDDIDHLQVCIDGADEIDPDLNLVKGRGGALLHEKLVALRARRLVIIASSEKLVTSLGTRLPLPVEVVPFGWQHTAGLVAACGLETSLRTTDPNRPFITDGGHYILDCRAPRIPDPAALARDLKAIPGVVEHGLFIGMAHIALTIDDQGTISEHRPRQ